MELFKYDSLGGSPFQRGGIINGWDSVRWTERFHEAGEFEIKAPLSSGLRAFLPLDTFISHIDTECVMVVEDHEIEEDEDSAPMLKITGRDLRVLLDRRVVGANEAYNNQPAPPNEYLVSDIYNTAQQITIMINDHVALGQPVNSFDEIPYFSSVWEGDLHSPGIDRILNRQSLYKAVVDLCKAGDHGIRVRHERQFDNVWVVVHTGTDKTEDVTFTWETGEITSARYLFTSRKKKNTALVRGKWLETFVYNGFSGYDRRVLLVEAQDLDEHYETAAQANANAATIRAAMATRGQDALDAQNDIEIAEVEVKEGFEHHYRVDYDLGDLVSVRGNYGTEGIRRVTEYTEIEDENGESSHPTLSAVTN